MRRICVMAALAVALGAGTAQAQVVTLTANLSGANETPGVSTGAFGTAVVLLDLGARSWSWEIDIFNMPTGTTAAHFHVAGPDVAGPVVVNIPVTTNISNDFRLTGSANALTAMRPEHGIRSVEDFIQALVGGQIYLNIHSTANPSGEVRGQLVPRP